MYRAVGHHVYTNLLFLKAIPDAVFKYFSKAKAFSFFVNPQ